ncbi:MAG: LytR C-terminal domain-containing protein, partial [Burkholderiales bacterium]
ASAIPTHELKTTTRKLDEIPSVFLRTPASTTSAATARANTAASTDTLKSPATSAPAPSVERAAWPEPSVMQAKFSPLPTVQPLPPQFVRVMLSNASGSKMQAAVGAKRLREQGVKGLQVNDYHGSTANQTVVFYREGFRGEAELVLSMLAVPPAAPVTLVVTRLIPAGVDVRVVLGPHLRALPRITRAEVAARL